MRILFLFSSDIERDAAFPEGAPREVRTDIAGVGLVDAAIGATRAIASASPDAIVYLGTCGAHRDARIGVGDIAAATTLRLGSGDVARGDMRIPTLLASELECDRTLTADIVERSSIERARIVPATVSCTVGITETDELAAALCAHDGSHVENLEAFSIARAAGAIPVAVLLAVTNIVGAGGGRDWRKNYQHAMLDLARGVCGISERTDSLN